MKSAMWFQKSGCGEPNAKSTSTCLLESSMQTRSWCLSILGFKSWRAANVGMESWCECMMVLVVLSIDWLSLVVAPAGVMHVLCSESL